MTSKIPLRRAVNQKEAVAGHEVKATRAALS